MSNKSVANPSAGGMEAQADLRNLLLAQKTELVGQLAGAMANQFNNIMMSITSYAELELKKATPSQKRSLEQILNNSTRATTLIQKLLSFSRKHAPNQQRLELNTVVSDIGNLLQPLVGEEIVVEINLDSQVGAVNADQVELEQVVLSLAVQARDAMHRGGKLTVSTEVVNLDEAFLGRDGAQPGTYFLLSVRDTATGQNAQGTRGKSDQDTRLNLALAVVRGIVKESQGVIRVACQPGSGTNFKIYFPALAGKVDIPAANASTKNIPRMKTVLIVEDDDAVRTPAAELLKMEGFKVLQAREGAEALRIAEQNRSHLDLLVTDIVMAGMNGREVADKLLQIFPEMKVLFMSGDADKALLAQSGSGAHRAVLQKPFRLDKLNDKIRELIGE